MYSELPTAMLKSLQTIIFLLSIIFNVQKHLMREYVGFQLQKGLFFFSYKIHVRWVPVTTAWRVLGLRMEERPPAIEVSCDYIE
jgi:hypothetical protein